MQPSAVVHTFVHVFSVYYNLPSSYIKYCPWLPMWKISLYLHLYIFCIFAGWFYSVQVWRDIGSSEHQAYNTHTILLTAAFMLIISQAVCLCPLLDANTHSTHTPTRQWSASYHKHFFNSTFNLPGLKTPQTTIWHQPQLLHCFGTEERNVISTVNF